VWILRYFFIIALFAISLQAGVYPKTFSSLGTPLYKASLQLNHFSAKKQLHEVIQKYQQDVDKSLRNGLHVDKTIEKKKKLAYLKELRHLQKEYDYIIHLMRLEIEKSIQENDYSSFVLLTSYELQTLLRPRALREQALAYYEKHQKEGQIRLLEHIEKKKKLLVSTSQEFFNQTKSAQLSSHATDKTLHKDVYATTKRLKNRVDIFFTNTNLYDVTLRVKEKYKNIREKRNKERLFVLKAKSTIKYARLYLAASGASYSFSYQWIIGSKDARPDRNYIYRLPYAIGTSHMVSQGYNGITHKGHSQYAVDFKMDVGTKVYAARGGIVVKTKDDSNKRGFSKAFAKYGNYVTILHNDGTFGTYYHLKKGGVLVNVGEKVERGYALGYSGNTGYTSGPHLHFAVFKAVPSLQTKSIPIKFISVKGIVTNPKTGTYYKAK
jgi:murein DD-endopeptidase MepM/ murein hydrolase activator NlpD